MKIYYVFLVVATVSQTVVAKISRRGTLSCLKCNKRDDLTIAECINNGVFESCSANKPTCMTELWNNQGKIIFSSGCKQSRACAEVEANEPKINQCDKQPLIVETKCRYCCSIQDDLAPGGYCKFPAWKTCVVKGDPHFTTLDGYKYDFSGSCGYTLIEDIGNSAGADPAFKVSATNMYIGRTARVVDVNITVEGYIIELGSVVGKDESTVDITIDGFSPAITSFPYKLNEGRVEIDNEAGGYMSVSAPLAGLVVFWNKKYHVEIMLDTTLVMEGKLKIGGMCGNGNGNAHFQDELKTRGGELIKDTTNSSIKEFATSWQVTGTCLSV
ncbi:BMP-binding endothelial regulator protein-like [Saccoglossus kowalevskii]|uniref:Kielin/chordin-like protein-like n=1 Tax=Saccoglossus kowalevskii TaxID=10224 RepID=A0ABM0GT58_SACKO|nr:PREDICTED: kielin/chordin-like protein-like [Saccoglossus kowalevskii]